MVTEMVTDVPIPAGMDRHRLPDSSLVAEPNELTVIATGEH